MARDLLASHKPLAWLQIFDLLGWQDLHIKDLLAQQVGLQIEDLYAKHTCLLGMLSQAVILYNAFLIYLLVGGIAHLVERCSCTADVSGSSPLISTSNLF